MCAFQVLVRGDEGLSDNFDVKVPAALLQVEESYTRHVIIVMGNISKYSFWKYI